MVRRIKGLYHLLIALVANIWFGFPSRSLTIIGVTGTDGKTTTSTLIYEMLKAAGMKCSMITSVHAVVAGKTYDTGFHVTTPTAWWVQKYLREAVNHGDTHFVLEVTSHALSQHRVVGVKFAVGALTNVTHEHLDWHKTYENYLLTKLTLLQKAAIVILNHDDSEVYTTAIKKLRHKKIVTYGIRRDAMMTPKKVHFKTKLLGTYNQYNCLCALGAVTALGIDKQIAIKTLATFGGVSGRMEIIRQKPFYIIIDFAHTPNAITQVLRTVRPFTKNRLIHVFGSAGLRDTTKRSLMGNASAEFADMIILTEEDYRTENVNAIIEEIASGIPPKKDVRKYPDRERAINFALSEAKPGDTVIITGKGHEKSMCRGTIEYPWSDQVCVMKQLKNLS